jgi:ubiquinone/menaquinone biosynthesis C-methylase UbiE
VNQPSRTEAILEAWTAKQLSSAIAVMELLIATGDAEAAARCVERHASVEEGHGYDELLHLLLRNREGCIRAAAIARRFDDAPVLAGAADRIASTRNRFDWSVGQCEEASVALYSLGNAEMLRAATDEIVAKMRAWGLLGRFKDVLQIGCGIGRVEVAISPHVRRAVGVDISPQMIEAARRRAADLTNVHFEVGSGFDLAPFDDGLFDVVYAVDSMPYIVDAGFEVVEAHFRDAARVLRRDGELVVFEFSYRGDLELDRADVRRLSAAYGFSVLLDGISPFELWNGRVFRMRRA